MCASASSPNPSRLFRRGTFLLVALALLAGCATRESLELPDLGDWESRRHLLGQLDDWEFSGRIGVVAGDDGFNASLRWAQQGDEFRATVSGPLGIGTVRLDGDGGRVALTDKNGDRTVLEDAENDLYLRYGWTIPVGSLRYWALGIPDPGSPAATEFDEQGRLSSLAQAGWKVRITRYGDGGGQPMPTRLAASNDVTKVKLVIHDWLFFDQSRK
jgi:outer membrane lipoprotein LolB